MVSPGTVPYMLSHISCQNKLRHSLKKDGDCINSIVIVPECLSNSPLVSSDSATHPAVLCTSEKLY